MLGKLICFSLVLFCTTAFAKVQFGTSGANGQNGRNGINGRGGQDQVVIAGSQFEYVYSNGEDGSDGERGSWGGNAWDCRQPVSTYSVTGANGGSGGSGGNGGRGGSAGDVVVYHTSQDQLKNVQIVAVPGQGGYGGRGSHYGEGCRCSVLSWEIDGTTYTCQHGQNGNWGYDGSKGSNGQTANISIIKSATALENDRPSMTLALGSWLAATKQLTQHIWSRLSGSRNLFASGSQIPDAYWRYDYTFKTNVGMKWSFHRDAGDFDQQRVSITLKNKVPQLGHGQDVWIDASKESTAEGTVFSVDHAIYKKEVAALKYKGASGSGRNLTLHYVDESGHPEDISNTIFMKYYTRAAVIHYKRWEGWIPKQLVERDGNKVAVNIGRVNMDATWVRSGRKARVFVTARRKSGSRHLDLAYRIDHKIQ